MLEQKSGFPESKHVVDTRFFTVGEYHFPPGSGEPNHIHSGVEIVFVAKGNGADLKTGHVLMHHIGEPHEVKNNSSDEIVLWRLTIPPENDDNTVQTDVKL